MDRASVADGTQVFTTKPGPATYTSHFGGVLFASCLAFEAIQLISLLNKSREDRHASRKRLTRRCCSVSAYLYWIILTLSGFICLVTYSIIPLKDERIATQLFAFILGIIGILALSGRWPHILSKGESPVTRTRSAEVVLGDDVDQQIKQPVKPRGLRWLLAFVRGLDRLLRVVHALLAILFMAGGISLALTYRYDNP